MSMSSTDSYESTEHLIKFIRGPHALDLKIDVGYRILNSPQHEIPKKVTYFTDWISNLLIRSHDKKPQNKQNKKDDKSVYVLNH